MFRRQELTLFLMLLASTPVKTAFPWSSSPHPTKDPGNEIELGVHAQCKRCVGVIYAKIKTRTVGHWNTITNNVGQTSLLCAQRK